MIRGSSVCAVDYEQSAADRGSAFFRHLFCPQLGQARQCDEENTRY